MITFFVSIYIRISSSDFFNAGIAEITIPRRTNKNHVWLGKGKKFVEQTLSSPYKAIIFLKHMIIDKILVVWYEFNVFILNFLC